MNTEELAILATDITNSTDPVVQNALLEENYAGLANLYNEPEIYFAWLSSLPVSAYKEVIVWEEMRTGISPESARIWEWMTSNMSQPLNVSDADIRDGIRATWFDTTDTLDRLNSIAKRNLTTAEMLFKSGSGNGSPVDPYLFGWEGEVTEGDVVNALVSEPTSSVVVPLSSLQNRNINLIVTLPADLPHSAALTYEIRNQHAGQWTEWAGSTLTGLTSVGVAGTYSARLAGFYIKSAIAEIRIVCPYAVVPVLVVERA